MEIDVRQIPVDLIDTADTRFRITEPGGEDALARSVAQAGLTAPPVTRQHGSHFIVVAGFKRIEACRRLGWPRVPCRILSAAESDFSCLKIAIADNAWIRSLNLLEQARAVAGLRGHCESSAEWSEVATTLGLSVNPALADKLTRLLSLDPAVQRAVAGGHMSLNIAMALESVDRESAKAVALLFERLRPTVSQQKEVYEGLNDLARAGDHTIAGLLGQGDFAEIIDGENPDRGQKLRALRRQIRWRRFPALSRAEAEFYRRKRNLNLPEDMDLRAPPDFEDTVYTLALRFSEPRQLCRQAEQLGSICRHPDLAAILKREYEDS